MQRSEHSPISRGAAEQATGSDQCKDYAGRTRTRPNEAPRGERPMWDDSQVQIKSAGRGGRYRISRKGDSGRTSNNATPPAAHSHARPRLGWEATCISVLSGLSQRKETTASAGGAVRCARSAQRARVRCASAQAGQRVPPAVLDPRIRYRNKRVSSVIL